MQGEIEFKADGKTYTFVMDMNAIVDVEEHFDAPMADMAEFMKRAKDLRTVFRIGLKRHHPELDDAMTGDIMTALGLARTNELLAQGVKAAFPEATVTEGGGAPADATQSRPRQARRRTARSTR